MTNRPGKPSLQHYASGAEPPAGLGLGANRSVRKASVIAGIGLLLITALSVFGNFVAGDTGRCSKNSQRHHGFRECVPLRSELVLRSRA